MPDLSEKRSDLPLIAVALIIVAVLVAGEAVVYTSDYTDFSADASIDGGTVSFTVSAPGSKDYDVVVSDNGSHSVVDRLYVYHDESYASDYSDVEVAVGAKELDQSYYVEQIAPTLRYRGIEDVRIMDADALRDALLSDVSAGTSSSAGLLVLSGAFPETVYTGHADDPVLQWTSAGGSLYWLGNLIGKEYATRDGLVQVDGYQRLLFGAECLNTGDTEKAYSEVGNGYCHALSITNNSVRYGVDCSRIADRAALPIGFQEDGYASIAMVQYGSGMICVVAGDYSNMQRSDLAQVIASGIGPESRIVAQASGTASGTEHGTLEVPAGSTGLSAYICLGGYYPVYCKEFSLRGCRHAHQQVPGGRHPTGGRRQARRGGVLLLPL